MILDPYFNNKHVRTQINLIKNLVPSVEVVYTVASAFNGTSDGGTPAMLGHFLTGYFGYMSLLRWREIINFMILFKKLWTNSAVCGWLSQLRNARSRVT